MNGPMSNSKCPMCKSEQIEGNGFDVREDEVTQQMFCGECHKGWMDVYILDEQIVEGV